MRSLTTVCLPRAWDIPKKPMDSWQKSVDINPNQPNAHLYLAEAFDQRGEPAAAARHWNLFLQFAAVRIRSPRRTRRLSPSSRYSPPPFNSLMTNRASISLPRRSRNMTLPSRRAQQAGDAKLESLALVHRADLQARNGDAAAAAQSYQRGLALDAQTGDAAAEALDWFNYGQFLRRQNAPDELVYASFLHAENLLNGTAGSELATVQAARRQVESKMGAKAAAVAQSNLPTQLERATNFAPDAH